MDILAAHLQSSKVSHGGISQREYNEKFLLKSRPQTKKEPDNAVLQDDTPMQKFIGVHSDMETSGLTDDKDEGGSKFQSGLPQFRTFIDSLGGRNLGRGKQRNKWAGFPALEKLLLMDISTEESILNGAVQFSTTI